MFITATRCKYVVHVVHGEAVLKRIKHGIVTSGNAFRAVMFLRKVLIKYENVIKPSPKEHYHKLHKNAAQLKFTCLCFVQEHGLL